MADYKELLRRAISALPENNGAARRAVYEKARAALVGQLKAINPPLPAKDITQHRLQLEDCIRQVEHEASEAVISLKNEDGSARATRSRFRTEALPKPQDTQGSVQDTPAVEPVPAAVQAPVQPKPTPVMAETKPPVVVNEPAVTMQSAATIVREAPPVVETAPPQVKPSGESKLRSLFSVPFGRGGKTPAEPTPASEPSGSIEDIIADAERSSQAAPPDVMPNLPLEADAGDRDGKSTEPAISPRPANVSRIEPNRPPVPRLVDGGRRIAFEPRRDGAAAVAVPAMELNSRGQALALQPVISPVETVPAAMSAVREVEVETPETASDSQRAIENAIATLDEVARGETGGKPANAPIQFPPTKIVTPSAITDTAEAKGDPALDEPESLPRPGAEEKGGNAITIFLVVFAVLLAAAGGGGFWAWREGFIDMDAMFGRAETPMQASIIPAPDSTASAETEIIETADTTGPGNTTPLAEAIEPTPELVTEERLAPTPTGTAVTSIPVQVAPDVATVAPSDSPEGTTTETITLDGNDPAAVLAPTAEDKTEERLTPSEPAVGATADTADPSLTDPSAIAGSQSLLLEASDAGQGGAVPFSGTVDWSTGTDEVGLPTILAHANIPARNMEVDILFRKNSDASLPASHVMEIRFDVSETFIGGSIATLPGILLKNEELVQGEALAGASARIVGNSFLFALSERPEELTQNNELLTSNRWMDLAIVYATGKRAIITLEKDDAAVAMFTDVFNQWNSPSQAASAD